MQEDGIPERLSYPMVLLLKPVILENKEVRNQVLQLDETYHFVDRRINLERRPQRSSTAVRGATSRVFLRLCEPGN